ncbi:MAG: hypothetical protein M3O41_12350 [Pseudomonadota bacterium]|nr:hypothetical protein [Pseudomonadota bacterium]
MKGANRRRQRGAAALLMILTLIVIMTIVLAPRLTLWQVRNAAAGRGYQSLIAAKAAILAHAASPDADVTAMVPPRRLGQISLTPDLPVTAGSTYDGTSKPGCATTAWLPGQPLVDPNVSPVAHLNVRCFGRFPWLSYGLPGPSTPDDQDGDVPWMFVSANLVGVACVKNLNPLMLSYAYTGGCGTGTPVPFPWLTVVDGRGNIVSSQVAIVLILPGPPVGNAQQRTTPNDRSPAAYLEGLTVAAGCPTPCVPGTYDNAAYTAAAWTFIDAPPSTALGPPPSYYQQPFTFNDRLIYITAAEYFEAMETRARSYVVDALTQFKTSKKYLPSSRDNPSSASASCAAKPGGSAWLLAAAGCTADAGTLAYPLWFTAAGWGNYFIYSVDPGCVYTAPAPRCNAPSLRLGAAAQRYNAVLFSPGRAITTAPYAAPKGSAQAPVGGASMAGSLSLNDFLDSAANINANGPTFDAAGTLPTANYNDRMYGVL